MTEKETDHGGEALIDPLDRVPISEMRSMVASTKGNVNGPSAREPFDQLMDQTQAAGLRDLRGSGRWAVCMDGGADRTTLAAKRQFCTTMVAPRWSVRRERINISSDRLQRGKSGRLRARVRLSTRASVSGGGRRNPGRL